MSAERFHQILLIGATLGASWLGMQAVHESGHVLGAWLTGGRVERVVLHPLTISRTDLAENPHPLIVVWAGPLIGVIVPLFLWAVATTLQVPGAFLLRFFAGFCLIANGLYISLGSFAHIGDCGDMLRHGSQLWQLWLFGLVTAPAGILLWHNIGPHFGLGQYQRRINRATAYAVAAIAMVLAIVGLAFSDLR